MIAQLSLGFCAGLLTALLLTYFVRGWATRLGLVDTPDGIRRRHEHPVPLGGGVAIFAAAAIVLGFWLLLSGVPADLAVGRAEQDEGLQLLALIIGGGAMFLLGLWDDIHDLRPAHKFALQTVIAVAVFAAGVRIAGVGLPGNDYLTFPLWASLPITAFWLLLVTNAFNLIDGSDGVAAGAAVFALGSMFLVSLSAGNMPAAMITIVLAGATLGFLFFNFPPASIFLGDSGSLYLGFTLASLAVVSAQKAPTTVAIAIPIVAFGLPILDTALAVFRRLLRAQPIFAADDGHIHHRLRHLGLSPRRIAVTLYGAAGLFALLSLLLIQEQTAGGVFLVIGVVVLFVVQRLDIPEVLELRRILYRSLRQRSAIAHNVRIREAAVHLARAESPAHVLAALDWAFELGEFDHAQLRLAVPAARRLDGTPPGAYIGEQLVWERFNSTAADPEGHWSLELPLGDDNGARIGTLHLWRAAASEHVLTDLRLVALTLKPALIAALRRLPERAVATLTVEHVAPPAVTIDMAASALTRSASQ